MIGDKHTVYNVSGAILVDEILDREKVKQVVEKIIERHSALRTAFILEDNEVVQKIQAKMEFDVPTYNNTEDEMKKVIENFSKPFELENKRQKNNAISGFTSYSFRWNSIK